MSCLNNTLLPRKPKMIAARMALLQALLVASLHGVCESRGGGSDLIPRFSSSLPTYLPVSCQLQGAESSFFLREATQEVMRNGSLQTRSEPLFLHLPESGPAPLLSVNCSYGNLTAEAPVPPELLQGALPRSFYTSTHLTLGWKVRAHLVSRRIGVDRPQIQVLFYLAGRRWEDVDPPAELLPCIRVVGIRDPGEGSVSSACRLEGNLGICVAKLGIPTTWFNAPPPRRRMQEPIPVTVELHYSILPPEALGKECVAGRLQGKAVGQEGDMQRIGTVTLTTGDNKVPRNRLRLDGDVEILAPPSPVKQGQTVGFQVLMNSAAATEQFTLRVQYGEGIHFMVVKPSNLAAWEIKQEVVPGSSSLTMFCQRKASSTNEKLDGSFYEIMWVDFEIDNFINLRSSQSIRWQIEYPSTGASAEVISTIYIIQRDLQGIVPIPEDTEILNTAILTGRRVAIPVKVVTVEQDGTVREVDDPVTCISTDEDVLKVSLGCDEVLVNGKEKNGHISLQVNFTYLYLTSQLELTVWVPRLPLQIDVSDAELSQVKGWRVPIITNKRPTRDSEDDEEDERKGRGCALQYQYALVRVLTHFVAEPVGHGGELVHMLGSDWSADITEMVLDFLKVEDTSIARLIDGRVLVGRDPGITNIQVISPFSDSILAEKTITVVDDKVTISDLGVQLVGSLSLSLQASSTNNRAFYITTTAQDLLHTPKQEAIISAWIQYSDGSVTPLDIYDPKDFTVTITSLDENVVSTYQDQSQRWPVVVAEGEGQGALLRVEMMISETCQKSKRKSILAMGIGNVQVKFGQNDLEQRSGTQEENSLDNSTNEQKHKLLEADKTSGGDSWKYTNTAVEREESVLKKVSTTAKTPLTSRSGGSKQGGGQNNNPVDYTSFPAQVDLPGGADSDLTQAPRGLSDLEIGMYALLGVFCLAILVFLINCVSFAFRYRHKELPVLEQGNMNHAHDWVWLGNEADLMDHHGDHGPLAHNDECTTAIDRNEGCEESKYLLNGSSVQKSGRGIPQVHSDPRSCSGNDPSGKIEPLNNSPSAAKRKRVKFTSFATVLPDEGGPYTNSILIGNEDDIKWVCQDMDLGQSAELRSYMERLQDNL
ncbi:transmembrane protein 132C-like isoform X1 [Cyprinus carpio]|uniref:Transmembrane protein 132C-like isoform X1 n=1 Tax=Cyprinus carpio TaxID=7962 RepID=A0A9Q9ZZ90_CYPCA|nr:transmembrane protein 132C-like isoform X1 [Cyprinus carpio]